MLNLIVAAFLLGVYFIPDPPTPGLGYQLFGKAILSWPVANAVIIVMSALNFATGLTELFWT